MFVVAVVVVLVVGVLSVVGARVLCFVDDFVETVVETVIGFKGLNTDCVTGFSIVDLSSQLVDCSFIGRLDLVVLGLRLYVPM